VRARILLVVAGVAAAAAVAMAAVRNRPAPSPGAVVGPRPRPFAQPVTADADGLTIRLSDAQPPQDDEAPESPVAGTPLSDAETDALLARLPPLEQREGDQRDAAMRPASMPPPRAGVTRRDPWPPPSREVPDVNVKAAPLEVLRHAPDGDVPLAARLSIAFSQPMIAVTTQDAAAAQVPVKLTPQPDGAWRWAGTQLLVFEGPDAGRLPMATRYEVAIPAGTTSATGGKLAKDASFRFTTPPPKVVRFEPSGSPQGLDPLMVIVFDQRVEPTRVFEHLTLRAGGQRVNARLLDIDAPDEDGNLARTLVAESDRNRAVVLRTAQPLPKDAYVQVTAGKGTPSAEGPLTTTADQESTFQTFAPLKVVDSRCGWNENCPPRQPLWISFNNGLDAAKFDESWVAVEPAITDLDIEVGGSGMTLQGLTQARTTYSVRISPKLRDVFGQELGSEARVTWNVGHAWPELVSFGGPLIVADPARPPALSVWSAGQESLQVSLHRVSPDDWLSYLAANRRRFETSDRRFVPPGTPAWSGKVAVAGPVDERTETLIDLAPALSGTFGHVVAVVEATQHPKDGRLEPVIAWVEVTHLGLAAFADPQSLLTWTTELATGAPARDVALKLLPDGAPSGESGRDGLATLPLPTTESRYAEHPDAAARWPWKGESFPRWLVATRGDDTAILPENPGAWWGGSSWTKRDPGTAVLWHVLDDRGIYRPGETARVKGLLRRIDWRPHGDLSLVEGASRVAWVLRDSVGNDVSKGEAEVSTLGGFDFAVELPPTMNLGSASVQVSLAGTSDMTYHELRVEEFRRPEYEVKLDVSEGPYLLGGDALATATASYLAGGGLPDAPIAWRVTARDGSFRPPHWDEWSFGPFVPWWTPWSDDYGFRSFKGGMPMRLSGHERTFMHEARTDARGQHALRLEFTELHPPRATSVEIESTVTDVNRQAWSDRTTILVHPSDLWAGLRIAKPFVERGGKLGAEVIVTDRDGKAIVGREVILSATRVEGGWMGGELSTDPKDIVETTVMSEEDPVAATLALPRSGSWRVIARVLDDARRPNETEASAWVAGEPVAQGRGVEQQQAELIPDAKEYAPGQVARLLVRAPFAPAEGLLTLRRGGIVLERRFRMEEASQVVELEVGDDWWPSIHAQVDLAGETPRLDSEGKPIPKSSRPALATGSVELSVPARQRALAVEVSTRDATLEPGASTTIDLRVKDAEGRPASGEVSVIVADEAVLALTGYELLDPLATFTPARPADVSDHHLRTLVQLLEEVSATEEDERLGNRRENGGVVQEALDVTAVWKSGSFAAARAPSPMMAMTGAAAPGAPPPAAGPSVALRLDLSALALFAPRVEVGADGRASVPLKLPDSLTRWRVMAVAVSGPTRFGKGDASVVASKRLMVRPSLPRFLNYGDAAELPVVVQNLTDEEIDARVAMRLTNAQLTGARGLRVSIPANDRVELRFPATTDMAGTARVQVIAASGKLSDAAELSLPVWTPATTEAFATYGTLDSGAVVQPVAVPKDVLPGEGGLSLETSSTALFELGDAVLHLWTYPYACTEQIASRLLGVLALRDGVAAFSKLPPQAELDAALRSDIRTLVERQSWNGDVGLWGPPDTERRRWPWVATHASHALLLADQKGLAVPQEAKERAMRFLEDVEGRIPDDVPTEARAAIIAHALDVQRGFGRPAPQRAEKCLALLPLEKQSLETLAFLLPTLHESASSRTSADRIVQHLRTRAAEEAGTVTFTTSYGDGDWLVMHSSRRTDAVILRALLDVDPQSDLLPKIVRGLLDHRTRGAWDNTQENSFALLALDRYLAVHEAQPPDFRATAWLGDTTLAQQEFRGRSTEHRVVEVPMRELLAGSARPDVVISREGTGRLYYRLGMTYAPSSLKLDPSQHGFVVERAYEGVEDPHDVRREDDGSWHVRAGALVRSRLTMVAPARRTHVALVDPLPAGLEALNPSLEVSQQIPDDARRPGEPIPLAGAYVDWWWGPWFEHQNLRDERAEAFASMVWAGAHEYAYVTRATTPGRFVVPPAKAEEMYHSETFGRSASDVVIVE